MGFTKVSIVSIELASIISDKKLRELIFQYNAKQRQINFKKHFGKGAKIKRRNRKHEKMSGDNLKILNCLVNAKHTKKLIKNGFYEKVDSEMISSKTMEIIRKIQNDVRVRVY